MAIGDLKTAVASGAASITMTPASGEVWKVISIAVNSVSSNVTITVYRRESSTDYELFSCGPDGSNKSILLYGNHGVNPHGMGSSDDKNDIVRASNDFNATGWANLAGPGIFIDNSSTLKITASSGNVDGVVEAIEVRSA